LRRSLAGGCESEWPLAKAPNSNATENRSLPRPGFGPLLILPFRQWRCRFTLDQRFKQADYVTWSGQFEYLERAEARLKVVVPVTLLIIFLLLYLNFRALNDRVRPKMMTVAAIVAGLLPIMWSTGTGSEVMQRIAVPMIGGMISSTVLPAGDNAIPSVSTGAKLTAWGRGAVKE